MLRLVSWAGLMVVGAVVVSGCNTASQGTAGSDPSGSSPPEEKSPTSGKPAPTQAKPVGRERRVLLEHAPKQPIPSSSVAGSSGAWGAVEGRLMVSTITPEDGLRIAVRILSRSGQPVPNRRSIQDLKAEVTQGAIVQQVALGETLVVYDGTPFELVLTRPGLIQLGKIIPWVQGQLVLAPGTAQVRLTGTLFLGKEPVPLELVMSATVVEARAEDDQPSFLPISALVQKARNAALPFVQVAPPAPYVDPRVIDDAEGNRWVRLQAEQKGYDRHLVDVLITPSGKVLRIEDFSYFACVGEGTLVRTPDGATPVEELAVGNWVLGVDEHSGQLRPTQILAKRQDVRTDLVRVQGAWLTLEHPVLSQGQWVRAELVPGAVRTEGEVRRVFDLQVGPPHTYLAGQAIVHNKAVPVRPHAEDPWAGLFIR